MAPTEKHSINLIPPFALPGIWVQFNGTPHSHTHHIHRYPPSSVVFCNVAMKRIGWVPLVWPILTAVDRDGTEMAIKFSAGHSYTCTSIV